MITNAILATSGTDVLTAGNDLAVVMVTFCNSLSSSVTVDLYVVPTGDSVDISTKVVASRILRGYDSLFLDTGRILLTNGDKIHAVASANNAVGTTVSYIAI
jgi:hypothetical protein